MEVRTIALNVVTAQAYFKTSYFLIDQKFLTEEKSIDPSKMIAETPGFTDQKEVSKAF